jgi:hypothetical protein
MLSRLQIVADDIADMHGARVDKHELEDGTWVVSIEHDDWAITGSGFTETEAFSDLIQNAKAEGAPYDSSRLLVAGIVVASKSSMSDPNSPVLSG